MSGDVLNDSAEGTPPLGICTLESNPVINFGSMYACLA